MDIRRIFTLLIHITQGAYRGVRNICYQPRHAKLRIFGERSRTTAPEQGQDFHCCAPTIRKLCDSEHLFLKVQDESEPYVVVPIGWRVVVAVGSRAIGCIVVPIAAANNTRSLRPCPA